MKHKNKIVLLSILAVFMLIAVTATVSAAENVVWYEPENSNATHCNTTDVDILLNATEGVVGFDIWIVYDPDCADITNAAHGNFPLSFLVTYEEGATHMFGGTSDWNDVTGDRLKIATITIHCENESGCPTPLDLDERCELGNATGGILEATWHDGTFTCVEAVKPDLEITEKSETLLEDGRFNVTYTVSNTGAKMQVRAQPVSTLMKHILLMP